MTNALTVDVEDWYHDVGPGGARLAAVPEGRVEANLLRLLDVFDAGEAQATLFVLGEVAERFPRLVREAAARGHEIASHGYRHERVTDLLRREFRDDVERSLGLLTDLAGEPVVGYRAPYFSIKADVRWPIEALAAAGVRYDSSILPIDRAPGLELVSPRSPYRLPCGIWEVPVSMPRFGFWHLPLVGGFALRTLPYRFVSARLADFQREVGPAVVHLHPWEIDAESPEPSGVPAVIRGWKRFGRGKLVERLGRLLREHRFAPIRSVFPQVTDRFSPRESRPSAGSGP